MVENKEKLKEILNKVKLTSSSIKEVSKLYFETKKIVFFLVKKLVKMNF